MASRLANPADYIGAQKNAATGKINRNFDATGKRITSKLAGLGFGESGKLATNIQQNELDRAGAQSSNEGQFAGLKQQYDEQTLHDAMGFAFQNPGSTKTQTGAGPGAVGGAISGGLSTATTLFALNHFMQGGGNGGNSNSDGGPPIDDSIATDGGQSGAGGEY